MSCGSLYHYQIPLLEQLTGCVFIETFAGILETHFIVVSEGRVVYFLKPVEILQLAASWPVCYYKFLLLSPFGYTTSGAVVFYIFFFHNIH